LLLPHGNALFRCFAIDCAFDFEKPIDAAHRLDGDRRLVQFRQIEKIPSSVTPACGLNNRSRFSAAFIERAIA